MIFPFKLKLEVMVQPFFRVRFKIYLLSFIISFEHPPSKNHFIELDLDFKRTYIINYTITLLINRVPSAVLDLQTPCDALTKAIVASIVPNSPPH